MAQRLASMGTWLKRVWHEMSRLGQIQVGLALAALVATVLSSVFFVRSVLAEGQACYGVAAGKNPCSTGVTGQVVVRLVVVLAIVLGLYAGVALLAFAQQRAREPSARMTAFMFLLTISLLVLGMTMSAVDGPGKYLLPSLALLLASDLIGIVLQVLDSRVTEQSKPTRE